MHDQNKGTVTACDDAPDRLGAWLRLLAHDVATALSWRWLLHFVPAVLVFLANVRARVLLGRTAILRPSRSGGADHGLRAVRSGRNPMVFGGPAHGGAACLDTAPRYLRPSVVRLRLATGDGGWVATRRVVTAWFPLRWPGDCAANEAK